MLIPTIKGIIDRRILINYQVNANVMSQFLPPPFKPKLVEGKSIAGICLIRLKNIRPKHLPAFLGINSENGAHRIAVEWQENGLLKEGVYIPRRDTSSRLNALAGGRFFPGVHHYAQFTVEENPNHYSVAFQSEDGESLSIQASPSEQWNTKSVFKSLEEASHFFECGSVGYSPNSKVSFDGLKLKTYQWKVSNLAVSSVHSSFFENEKIFPKGSVLFDNALLMQNIPHEWQSLPSIRHRKKGK